ncbi:glycerol kinase [Plectosphaerella plurivora]|uniref:glycerol kinase n=1 Tax=Plectosphaerella plurivora TaxID=936078 RepID=A0A9P8VLL6_9PEZI|nr:glycerol kinase [Plectosphaerella plurivora]
MFQAVQELWAHLSAHLPESIMSTFSSDSQAGTPSDTTLLATSPPPVSSPYRASYTTAEVAKLKERGFVAAIDVGTTSARFIIFATETSDPIVSAQEELHNIHPRPGWHEQDANELVRVVTSCMNSAYRQFISLGFDKDDVKALGVTNQRETTIVWDWENGDPLYHAIVWTDTRTTEIAEEMKQKPFGSTVPQLTGLPWSCYPSLTKLAWLYRNVDKVKELYCAGSDSVAFGTVDTWLIYCLNGGAASPDPVHVTDSTNASRTMLMNLSNLHWEDSIIGLVGLDRARLRLPKIVASSDATAFGRVQSGPWNGLRITGCLGDQSAALVGQCAFEPGQAKNTYGTGCFLLYNTGSERPKYNHLDAGLIATVAYDFHPGGDIRLATYALEGSVASAGSGIKFLIKNLHLADSPEEINRLAASVADTGGVVFVTAFSGLLAPYWINDARGTMFGITHHTQRGHIVRAVFEATCYQTKAILGAMESMSGSKLTSLAVDGGMSSSDICMQTQANVLNIPILRPAMRETTALGAAYAAGLAVGCWSGTDELVKIKSAKEDNCRFVPDQAKIKETTRRYRKWNQAVEMSRGWVRDDDPVEEDDSDDEGNPA